MIEVIDASDDERYFPQGYFPSLEAANTAIDEYAAKNKGAPPCSERTEPEYGVVLELRQLNFGWTEPALLIRREWEWGQETSGQSATWAWKEVT